MDTQNRTVGPWEIQECGEDLVVLSPAGARNTGRVTAVAYERDAAWTFGEWAECYANAEFIVRACNAYDDLVGALTLACGVLAQVQAQSGSQASLAALGRRLVCVLSAHRAAPAAENPS